MEGLFFGRHLGGDAGDHRVHFKRIGALRQSGKDVAGGDHQQRNFLAKALGDGDGLGEEHLLVFAEALLIGGQELRAAGAHDAHAEHDDVVVVGGVRARVHFSAKGLAASRMVTMVPPGRMATDSRLMVSWCSSWK